ncbi:MAG: hypothetical protein JWM12_1743 [Ilumatobacteraceae bacterium]|nr:hypothetical protein [Ilumatobacteraceae bacterium]
MHVSEIWIYPVKSMVGGTVETAEVDALGLVGDRGWATRDEVRGGIRGAKKIGELMQFTARYTGRGGEVMITCPDGTTIATSDDDADERLSTALAHPVTLWPLQPVDALDHYRRGPADGDDPMAEIRAVFGREDGEPLPDFSVFPPEIIEFESPPGTYVDAFPLMLMTTSALAALAAAVPEATVDVRRFRPSVVIDTGDRRDARQLRRGRSGRSGVRRLGAGQRPRSRWAAFSNARRAWVSRLSSTGRPARAADASRSASNCRSSSSSTIASIRPASSS